MDTTKLKKFAQFARRALIEQVAAKLEAVRAEGSAAQREHPAAFKKLEASIAQHGADEVIERVAYIWFNRFTALRFLDVNELSAVRVVSPLPGQFQPEILADAKAGNINEQLVPKATCRKVRDLLEGLTPSQDPQSEAYRLLLGAICNSWQTTMPFLFERIDDYTELLLPADLLSNASILAYLREAMTPDACQDVEIIGWLYQFYISEKKDQVFAGLKKNQKITAENIPAATQLFTPHWIVRYLVENSLGRLWLLNRPGSKLAERMDYYIAPEEPETDFLKITKPEEIKLCDPACGSGHMLTYAFDLLHAIYEEEGYEADKIPALILANNLTGVEIDDRAGALAAFALAMKAAARLGRRRFLRMEMKPDIAVLQNVTFTPAEMQDVAAVVGRDLFTDELCKTLLQFEHAKNFGSLIVPKLRDPAETLRVVKARDFGGDLLLKEVQERVLAVLRMAKALSPKYHVVVANPPYMGSGGMNAQLAKFAKEVYPDSKSDLFAMFIERAMLILKTSGVLGILTIQNWMFLSSFEKLRGKLISKHSIIGLNQIGFNSFPELNSKFAVASATLFEKDKVGGVGAYIDLHSASPSADKEQVFFQRKISGDIHQKRSNEFRKIPGSPIAYSAGGSVFKAFSSNPRLKDVAHACSGLQTGDNDLFLKQWYEVSANEVMDKRPSADVNKRWRFHRKGGDFRKWYGNIDYIVDWKNDGRVIREHKSARPQNLDRWHQAGVTWSHTSLYFGARELREIDTFNVEGPSAFYEDGKKLLGFLCSRPAAHLMNVMNPTLHFLVGSVSLLPITSFDNLHPPVEEIVEKSRSDWDAYETSWDFSTLPLLSPGHRGETLEDSYATLRAHWQSMTDEMQRLEEENNRIFIDAYGLQDELTPEVPIEEITLTCNPAYRYGVKCTEGERETRLRADTMAEYLSYAVGCMFGRYSLDAPGLILANQGARLSDYLARVPDPSFLPDEDNVIPVLESDWFADDIVDRLRKFLRVTFGDAHFRENLAFVEAQIGDIRKYFTRGFYDDHVKRYKKRPIYWMFSSPRGTFQALIYMHRYRPDTVSVLLNDYLREFIRKLEAERGRLEKLSDDPSASQTQRTKALKDVGVIAKQIAELEEWEREVIFPLAQAKIEIDLDDGVKRNYPLFGAALKPIQGLEAADE